MPNSERNFRSHYYEKVGFRGVEEKKSLDLILADVPVDLEKLQNFCLRLAVPGINRSTVWRILLGILPVYTTSQENVWKCRSTQIEDLQRGLKVTRKLGTDTITNLTLIWLLNTNRLKYDVLGQLAEPECKDFAMICGALAQILEHDTEVIWVGMKLHEFLKKHAADRKSIKECLLKLLMEDDQLAEHLESTGILDELVASPVLSCGLAPILSPALLSRLWDKVIGGSFKVMLYTLAAFLVSDRIKPVVIQVSSWAELLQFLSSMTEVEQENVLSHGIDVWEVDGCPLIPGTLAPHLPTNQGAHNAADSTSIAPDELSTIDHRLSREINIIM